MKNTASIATAQVGQIITPEITQAIGEAHNAEYLIQGTIINLGTGAWWSDDYEVLSGALNLASALISSAIPIGGLGDLIGGIDISKTGIGVQCDIRVIKATTGEVIWSKRVGGAVFIVIGSTKVSQTAVHNALKKAAFQAVDALNGRLFGKRK